MTISRNINRLSLGKPPFILCALPLLFCLSACQDKAPSYEEPPPPPPQPIVQQHYPLPQQFPPNHPPTQPPLPWWWIPNWHLPSLAQPDPDGPKAPKWATLDGTSLGTPTFQRTQKQVPPPATAPQAQAPAPVPQSPPDPQVQPPPLQQPAPQALTISQVTLFTLADVKSRPIAEFHENFPPKRKNFHQILLKNLTAHHPNETDQIYRKAVQECLPFR